MQRLPRGFIIDPSRIVSLEDVSSMECYELPDGRIARRMLEGISFTVAGGQRYALLGDDAFDLKLLTEIIGNIKPYESGRCSLVGLGMMREKQRILQQVYYINEQSRVYPHMQGISYLMFASRNVMKNTVDRQLMWLKRLMEFGLDRLCFTYVRNMTTAEWVLMLLLLALDAAAPLLLLDLSMVDVPEPLIDVYAHVLRSLTEDAGKTVVFSTTQRALCDKCATHAAMIIGGRLDPAHTGSLEMLYETLDKRLYTLRAADDAVDAVTRAFPDLRVEAEDGVVSIYGEKEHAPAPSQILDALEAANVEVRNFARSEPTLAEAMKEVIRGAV
ncbi:MAG: hypothetical protein ACOYI5_08125 [Christensenellales bacterium]|jgi:ABC-2 type transport system ATP-binding protein